MNDFDLATAQEHHDIEREELALVEDMWDAEWTAQDATAAANVRPATSWTPLDYPAPGAPAPAPAAADDAWDDKYLTAEDRRFLRTTETKTS